MTDKLSLGIDIGGTKISAGLVNNGKIVGDILKISTPKMTQEIYNNVIDIIKEFVANNTVQNIGIATAGVVNTDTGQVLSATENLAKDYKGINYKELVEKEFNIPAFVDNDANAAAIAEHKFGAAKGYKNAIIATIGTGIGAGLIINNEIYRSSTFAAGECGHFIINQGDKRLCTCGKYDCWEAYASGTGLNTTARQYSGLYNSYKVFNGVKNNQSDHLEIFNIWHDHLAIGIINLMNILSPECIVLGGSLAEFIDYIKLKELTRNKAPIEAEIKKAELGNNAGIIGIASINN